MDMQIDLHELISITDNFSDHRKIGSGGYADVYKATYRGEEIAVKLLDTRDGIDDNQLMNELRNHIRVQHPNIVRLVGYCNDERKGYIERHGEALFRRDIYRVLCFEYMAGGSLEKHISENTLGNDWHTHYSIIKGICKGLHYLHCRNEPPIIHLGLRPTNILFDRNMMPKLSDFGLSRIFVAEECDIIDTIEGTVKYMPPELIHGGEISEMTDIFSLGVTIIEVIRSHGFDHYHELGDTEFIEDVRRYWIQRDRTARLDQLEICTKIAIRCVDPNRKKRPTIQEIVVGLDINLETNLETQASLGKTMDLNLLERIVAGTEKPSHLDLPLLQKITENFSEKKRIGYGGCGDVYEGIIRNGVVAVKRLYKSRTIKDKMFHREVTSLVTARHENIVRLLGYCSVTEERAIPFQGGIIMADIKERLLCFEFIRNGSLENYLTDELRGLEWHTRYEIIVGICKGLLYLHNEKDIVHMDLKPANILLDDGMVPKITDFGLSRVENSQSTTTTCLVSLGYCAPEYLSSGKSSRKSDIYSLGVMITELVTGSKSKPNLTKVLRRWRHRWIKSSKDTPSGYQQVRKCLELAQRCIQIDPTSRPDISEITNELNIKDKEDQFPVIHCIFEDILGIEPLEIHIPSELDQQISHSIKLTNDTDHHIAFMTKVTTPRCFHAEPNKGIVPPQSKCSVTIKVQAQVHALPNYDQDKQITVLSSRVDGSLASMDVTNDMFIDKESKVVDEVNVMVISGKSASEEDS